MRARSVAAAAAGRSRRRSSAPACSAEREPVRVGVLLECSGSSSGSHDSVLAAASLPLLERGGRRTGEQVTGSAGGRRVELLPACTEFTYLHKLVFATRRLVEVDGVDVVIGPIGGAESVVFRDLARTVPRRDVHRLGDGGAGDDAPRAAAQPLPVRPDRRADDGGARDLRLP